MHFCAVRFAKTCNTAVSCRPVYTLSTHLEPTAPSVRVTGSLWQESGQHIRPGHKTKKADTTERQHNANCSPYLWLENQWHISSGSKPQVLVWSAESSLMITRSKLDSQLLNAANTVYKPECQNEAGIPGLKTDSTHPRQHTSFDSPVQIWTSVQTVTLRLRQNGH